MRHFTDAFVYTAGVAPERHGLNIWVWDGARWVGRTAAPRRQDLRIRINEPAPGVLQQPAVAVVVAQIREARRAGRDTGALEQRLAERVTARCWTF